MSPPRTGYFALLALLSCFSATAAGQAVPHEPGGWTSTPTDQFFRQEAPPANEAPSESLDGFPRHSTDDFRNLLRPRFDLAAEWEPRAHGLSIGSYDASVRMPVYPFFGPPPPFISGGYAFTQIDDAVGRDLPAGLHDISLGVSWLRPINEKWTARFMLSGAFASDFQNTGSEAWQIRGGGFALYRPNERWSFAVGALVTGRDDIPVVPAVGVVWEPSPEVRINLTMPRPTVSFLMSDNGRRQHWAVLGGGLSGGTWAYRRSGGLDDRLSYREWRLFAGWENTPRRTPGSFGTTGTVITAEVGYVLGREFEFDGGSPDVGVQDALLLRGGISF